MPSVELTSDQLKYANKMAEKIEFGPQTNHARMRHNALMVIIEVIKEIAQGK